MYIPHVFNVSVDSVEKKLWFVVLYHRQGFWYFAEKKAKFAEKSADFAGKKSKFAQKSADFEGFSREKVKIRRKIGRFRGILAEKMQISKDFRGKF